MKQRDYQRRYYEQRKAKGCFDCGEPKGKGSTLTRCSKCKKAHRQNSNEQYRAKVLASS